VESTGRRIITSEADVRDVGALQKAFDAGVAQLGAVTIVVANAGIGPSGAASPEQQWEEVVAVNRRQISATRNAGARAARGALLVFVDADTVVPVGPVAGALEEIASGGVAGGARCAFDGTLPLWARLLLPPLLALYRRARLTPGAFLFCTREAFDAVGGFDESVFGGEEVLMARALDRFARTRGRRFTIVPSPIVTSGRKLRAYSGWQLLGTLARQALRGRRGARRREGFEMWYGHRPVDPGARQLVESDRGRGARS
jgi:NAD(P)-dependent dehydrogenase (short-subunit alcohol dehydrogenase family)